ncbi:MAG: hypothetical protein ABI333_11735 [bacterium]
MEQPELQVDPPVTLFFPRVIAGTVDRAPLVLHNVGRAPLVISEQGLVFGRIDGPFTLEDPPALPATIEAGESLVLNVLYTPTIGSGAERDEDTLTVASNDPEPERAVWVVNIRSSNTGPVISILPHELDFSLVEGHRGPITFTVLNSGTEPTTVADLRIEGGPEFSMDFDSSSLPRALDVGETFSLQVTCSTAESSNIDNTTGIATLIALPEDPSHQAGTATLYGPPTANAGDSIDTEPMSPFPVELNGRGSRSLGNTISSYAWTVVSWPAGSMDASAFNAGAAQTPDYEEAPSCPPGQNTVSEPCFIPDVPGVYLFELRTKDLRPFCELGNTGEVDPCETGADCCSFSCNGAVDSQGNTTCDGSTIDGICRDGSGCEIDSVNVSTMEVRALGQGIIVYLEWDGTGDFDLHLADDYGGRCVTGGTVHLEQSCKDDTDCQPGDTCDAAPRRRWGGTGDCYWNNAQPDWGVLRATNDATCTTSFDCVDYPQYADCIGDAGAAFCTNTLDDPRLLKDEDTAFGPEIIKLRDPIHAPGPANVYHLGAYYFPHTIHFQPRIATVSVFYEGIEVFAQGQPGVRLSRVLNNTGGVRSFWYVGWLVVNPGGATLIANPGPIVDTAVSGFPALQDPP